MMKKPLVSFCDFMNVKNVVPLLNPNKQTCFQKSFRLSARDKSRV